MLKKTIKPLLICSIVLIGWLITAQSCFKMRMADSDAKNRFAKEGINLYTETIIAADFKIHYAKTGNDTCPTLFFVHGSPGSWDAFSIYLKDTQLLSKYRMIAIDRPGFGYSQFGDAKNMAEQTVIIADLLKKIQNHKPLYIIGHSLGGPLAANIAAENPSVCTGIVLLAASVDPAEEPTEIWRSVLLNSPLEYLLPGAFKPSNAEIWYAKKELIPLAAKLKTITCAVWIIHGDKDGFVPVGNTAYAAKMLVNAKSVHTLILKGASHFIPWDPWFQDIKAVLMQL